MNDKKRQHRKQDARKKLTKTKGEQGKERGRGKGRKNPGETSLQSSLRAVECKRKIRETRSSRECMKQLN